MTAEVAYMWGVSCSLLGTQVQLQALVTDVDEWLKMQMSVAS